MIERRGTTILLAGQVEDKLRAAYPGVRTMYFSPQRGDGYRTKDEPRIHFLNDGQFLVQSSHTVIARLERNRFATLEGELEITFDGGPAFS